MQSTMTSVTSSMASTSRRSRWPMAGYRLAMLAIGGSFVGGICAGVAQGIVNWRQIPSWLEGLWRMP